MPFQITQGKLGYRAGDIAVALKNGTTDTPEAVYSDSGKMHVLPYFWNPANLAYEVSTGGLAPGGNVNVTNFPASYPVTGAFLTDAQLRAAPVPISGDVNQDTTASGSITAQNTNLGGTASANSAVEITTNNKGTVTLQVTGTYTGSLVVQITTNGTDWITQSGGNTVLLRMSDGVLQDAVPSGMNDIWQIETNGHAKVRVTAPGAVTGTAVISLRAGQGSSQVNIGNSAVDLSAYTNVNNGLNFTQDTTLAAYTQHQFRDDELFDTVVNGAGASAVWSSATGGVVLTVTNAGEYVIRQSKLSHQYLASAPHFWDLTTIDIQPVAGVVKRYGYYSSTTAAPYDSVLDGFLLETDDTDIWFRVYKQGAVAFERKQSQWDDPMNGRGRSGVVLNPSAFQAIFCEFLYLGGTEAVFGFLIGGLGPVTAHTFRSSNISSSTFVGSPNQPIRYEIRRNAGSGAATTHHICAKVGSKGMNIQKKKSRPHRYEVGGVFTFQSSAIGTEYAFIGVKLNTRHGVVHIGVLDVSSTTTDDFIVRVRRNPTLSAPLTYTAVTNTSYSIAYAPAPAAPTVTASGGTVVYDRNYTFVANQSVTFDLDNLLAQLGQKIDGTFDEFVVTIQPVTANLNIRGTLSIESAT